ncbi:MAG TPA: hypothetical protein VF516_31560 [Kofleriaceae bacterium]
MPDPNDNDDNQADQQVDPKVDPRVKELIDSATRAELERWFGLPSYEALADQGLRPEPPADEDPKLAERRKRQDAALAAIDPALVEAHRRRTEGMASILKPPPEVTLHIDPSIVQLDTVMIERQGAIADPRELAQPPDVVDALTERTPQALLRDLHRPELDFDKVFQRVDMIEEYRVDIAASIEEVMATSTRLPPPETPPFKECYALLHELRAERKQPWIHIEMPRRRVTE